MVMCIRAHCCDFWSLEIQCMYYYVVDVLHLLLLYSHSSLLSVSHTVHRVLIHSSEARELVYHFHYKQQSKTYLEPLTACRVVTFYWIAGRSSEALREEAECHLNAVICVLQTLLSNHPAMCTVYVLTAVRDLLLKIKGNCRHGLSLLMSVLFWL